MSIIPEFLLKRVYQKGSLRETAEGIAFDLKNLLGPGVVSGISFVKINDQEYNPSVINVLTSGLNFIADQVTDENPINFRLNQEGTLLLQGAQGLKDGINKIVMEILSPYAGKVQVTLTDSI